MPRPIFIIADLHLSKTNDCLTQGFFAFLEKTQREASALYILGDLFDAWMGDDLLTSWHLEVARKIKSVTKTAPCYFMPGNRDFLLGKQYCAKAGLSLITSPYFSFTHLGQIYTLLHGDILCTDDKNYQRYRKIVHHPLTQWLYFKLPKTWRIKFASNLRTQSQASNRVKSIHIMDVNHDAVLNAIKRNNCHHLIHGHTHRADKHMITGIVSSPSFRWVVGDWSNEGTETKAWYLQISEIPELLLFENFNKEITAQLQDPLPKTS